MARIDELAETMMRLTDGDGIHPTALPRLELIRNSTTTTPTPTVYEPVLCLVAQGAKQALLGDRRLYYDPGRYLIVSIDLPVIGQVTVASAEEPYLAFKYELDPLELGRLVLELGDEVPRLATPSGFGVEEASPELIDAAARLLRLLESPGDIPVVAPLVERELLYRVLTGPFGATIRQLGAAQGRVAQVARAIAWIKDHFAEPMRIEALAAEAGMSTSSLHEHFKAVTTLSPLQYQKRLRLQEARRLMFAQGLDAAEAGFRVGYESPSQFSREYGRLFGAPPARDIARLRVEPQPFLAA